MSRDKQIREMEQIGSKRPCDSEDCSKCLAMNRRCNDFLFAERLYNAGYRKSTDLAEEIFAEIERQLNDFNGSWADTVINTQYLIAELKKKYTQDKGRDKLAEFSKYSPLSWRNTEEE